MIEVRYSVDCAELILASLDWIVETLINSLVSATLKPCLINSSAPSVISFVVLPSSFATLLYCLARSLNSETFCPVTTPILVKDLSKSLTNSIPSLISLNEP